MELENPFRSIPIRRIEGKSMASTTTRLFPPEIETEILLRLPAKSILRFKCVSKSWQFTINSDAFATDFYQHNRRKNPQLLFLKHPLDVLSLTNPIHFSLGSIQSNSFVETTTLYSPNDVVLKNSAQLKPTKVELINSNSVNGVIAIVVYLGVFNGPSELRCDMYVWNPVMRENVRLPNSEVSGLFDRPLTLKFSSGFGFDKVSGDYKVVRVVNTGSDIVVCELYSLKKNCWKNLSLVSGSGSGSGISSNMFWASEMCTFVDGIGYWGVYRKESKHKFSVLGFDFCDEKFKKIKVPEVCINGDERKFHSLWEFRESLALSVLHFGGFETGSSQIYIWVLDQCWISMFNIDLESGPKRPVLSLGNGQVVLLGKDDGEHVLYDPGNGNVKKVNVWDVDHVVLYVENLVSLRKFMAKDDNRNSNDSMNDRLHHRFTPKQARIASDRMEGRFRPPRMRPSLIRHAVSSSSASGLRR